MTGDRVSLTYPPGFDAVSLIRLHFSHYDLRVYLSDVAYIDVGAGSLSCSERIEWMVEHHVGSLGKIGRYCEFALDARILADGNHANTAAVNVTLAELRMLRFLKPHLAQGLPGSRAPAAPIDVGSGVVISGGARVMPGVRIGDGAVVGAGAIVTKDVEPYSIVAGNPAREIRKRVAAERWWNWSTRYLIANAEQLQALAAAPGDQEIRPYRPPFIIRFGGDRGEVLGILDGEIERPISEAPPHVRRYVDDVFSDRAPYWIADCWET